MTIQQLVSEINCNQQCRFTETPVMTTCMYYPPVYDKNGVNVNPDMNTTTFFVKCSVCKKEWKGATRGGETTYTEV